MLKSKIQAVKDRFASFGRRVKSFVKAKTRTKKSKVLFVIGLLAIGILVYFFWGIPLPTKLTSDQPAMSTKLFDRNNKLIYEIFTQKKRSPISLTDIPQNIKNATIAIEDSSFYQHRGIDFSGILRATLVVKSPWDNSRVGSTSTSSALN